MHKNPSIRIKIVVQSMDDCELNLLFHYAFNYSNKKHEIKKYISNITINLRMKLILGHILSGKLETFFKEITPIH